MYSRRHARGRQGINQLARIGRVHPDQADDLTLFQNQAGRWKTVSLTGAQAAVDEYEAELAELTFQPHLGLAARATSRRAGRR